MAKPSDWSRIDELFAIAAGLVGEERAAFLADSCSGDLELRLRLDQLLAAADLPDSPLDQPPVEEAAKLLTANDADSNVGRRIGSYRILREIGSGGMGTVYLAERGDAEFRQQVAIKLIKRGLETELIVGRFERERRILAALDHPNIARLLDGGSTESGRPYLVMEYIDGESIDRYCDHHGLAISERLRLFRVVCSAVQFAHQRLAIHRDIKPSNVLVTADGAPKLLDFGLAKLLAPDQSAGETDPTITMLPALTPEYASPEQVQGHAVTTATDIYGLGALLYKLLTGHPVHRIENLDAPTIARAICDVEPVKPSLVVAGVGGENGRTRESVAQARSTQPARLARLLSGDLDNITLKALRKEPERRYETADRFSDDVRRFLEGLPVLARTATLRYRTGKFLRRHRAAVVAAASMALLIVAFSITLGLQARGTARQRSLVELERAKAEEVSSFLIDIFGVAGDRNEAGRRISAKDLIERGLIKARRDFVDQPLSKAALFVALGIGYRKLGLYEQALPLFEEAVAIRSKLLGDDHLDTATGLHELGRLRLELAQYDSAQFELEKAVEIREARLGGEHPQVAESLEWLSNVWIKRGDYGRAEALERRVLAISRRSTEPRGLAVASGLHGLGQIEFLKGRYEEAVVLLEEALKLRRNLLTENDPDLGNSYHDLGAGLVRLREFSRARSLLEHSLLIYEGTLGEDHPYVASALQSLAVCHADEGRYEVAEPLYRRALVIISAAVGAEHPDVATITHNLGFTIYRKGDLVGADETLGRAQRIYEATVGADHPTASYTLHYRGVIARRLGDFEAADRFLGRTLKIRTTTMPGNHEAIAKTLSEIGRLRREQGELDEAESKLREALTLQEGTLRPDHPNKADTLYELAEVSRRQGQDDEALRLARRALEIRREALGDEHQDTLAAAKLVARLAESRPTLSDD